MFHFNNIHYPINTHWLVSTYGQWLADVSLSGTEPKNHLNENIRRMRQIQRENKRREQSRPREQPVKALWKSSKFENVPPRVFDFQVSRRPRHMDVIEVMLSC